MNKVKKIIKSTIPITIIIKYACAQVFLLGCVPSPKAQTKNMINPTSGIIVMRNVINQSPIDIG
jgi:hypothetical protein